MTVSIFLSTSFNIVGSSRSFSMHCLSSSWWAPFSNFFACVVIFDGIQDIVHFTSLGAGYFCIPVFLFFKSLPKGVRSLLILERGMERARNVDVRNTDRLLPVRTPTGDQTHNVGVCPGQELNPMYETTLQLRHTSQSSLYSWLLFWNAVM